MRVWRDYLLMRAGRLAWRQAFRTSLREMAGVAVVSQFVFVVGRLWSCCLLVGSLEITSGKVAPAEV